MGSVLLSTQCHYCGERANTQDHVVPRCVLPRPQSRLPYWFRSQNVVPACKDCNGRKSDFRSDCTCPQCNWCWATAMAVFLPVGFVPRGYIRIQKNQAMVG